MPFFTNYISDLTINIDTIKPDIEGQNLVTGESLTPEDCLNTLNNYIDISGYYELDTKFQGCGKIIIPRRLILREDNIVIEVEYYQPFDNFDWSSFEQLNIQVKTIGERINSNLADLLLN